MPSSILRWCKGLVHQLAIAGDVFTGDGVHHGEFVVFDVTKGGVGAKMEGSEGVRCCDGIGCNEEIVEVVPIATERRDAVSSASESDVGAVAQ